MVDLEQLTIEIKNLEKVKEEQKATLEKYAKKIMKILVFIALHHEKRKQYLFHFDAYVDEFQLKLTNLTIRATELGSQCSAKYKGKTFFDSTRDNMLTNYDELPEILELLHDEFIKLQNKLNLEYTKEQAKLEQLQDHLTYFNNL